MQPQPFELLMPIQMQNNAIKYYYPTITLDRQSDFSWILPL